MSKKILFLQPRAYFERLGFDFEALDYEVDFGVVSLTSYKKRLSSYACVFSCIDHSGFSRFLCQYAREKGVPSIIVMDGVFEWSNATKHPFLNKLGVNLLSPFSYSMAMVCDEGLRRYLEKKGVNVSMYYPGNSIKGRGDDNGYILITTANSPYFDEAEKSCLVAMYLAVINHLRDCGVSYKFRIFDEGLLEALSISHDDNIVDGAFEEALVGARAVISTPSTVVVTSMMYSLPVAIADYRDGPLFINSGWRINGAVNLEDTIKSMLSRDVHRMSYQEDFCSSLKRANDACVDLIEKKTKGKFSDVKGQGCAVFSGDRYVISLEYPARCAYLFLRRKSKLLARLLGRIAGK